MKKTQEPHKQKQAMQKGYTMDYYNDDLPRKVAKRLLEDEKPAKGKAPAKQEDDEIDLDLSMYRKKSVHTTRKQMDEDDEVLMHQADESSLIKRFALGIGSLIVLVVFFVMILRINSISAKLKTAEAQLENLSGYDKQISQLKIDNEALAEKNNTLIAENEALKTMGGGLVQNVPDATPAEPIAPVQTATPVVSQTPTATPAPVPAGSASHTVAKGETLSSISKTYYGSSNQYQRIMDANNMTKADIREGQVLVIPMP